VYSNRGRRLFKASILRRGFRHPKAAQFPGTITNRYDIAGFVREYLGEDLAVERTVVLAMGECFPAFAW
jgi:hypothetical protein